MSENHIVERGWQFKDDEKHDAYDTPNDEKRTNSRPQERYSANIWSFSSSNAISSAVKCRNGFFYILFLFLFAFLRFVSVGASLVSARRLRVSCGGGYD